MQAAQGGQVPPVRHELGGGLTARLGASWRAGRVPFVLGRAVSAGAALTAWSCRECGRSEQSEASPVGWERYSSADPASPWVCGACVVALCDRILAQLRALPDDAQIPATLLGGEFEQ